MFNEIIHSLKLSTYHSIHLIKWKNVNFSNSNKCKLIRVECPIKASFLTLPKAEVWKSVDKNSIVTLYIDQEKVIGEIEKQLEDLNKSIVKRENEAIKKELQLLRHEIRKQSGVELCQAQFKLG
jgi:hypothetical protein